MSSLVDGPWAAKDADCEGIMTLAYLSRRYSLREAPLRQGLSASPVR